MIADYQNNLQTYKSMKRYYDGEHDIYYNYNKFPYRNNSIVIDNYVNKFVNEEVQYSLGNPLSYVSLSNDNNIIHAIYTNLFHWKDSHDQQVMRTLEIYGTAYLLHYIDDKGRFSERILSPYNAILYTDSDGAPICFIHFYKLKYDDSQYRDIYYPDGTIIIYKDNTPISKKKSMFKGIPVTECKLENVKDTIYYKIKPLQDAYNKVLSDQVNTISDYRNAYLIISGTNLSDEQAEALKVSGLLNLPGNGSKAEWLVKDMPDGYIQNMITNLRNSMYSVTNHIDGNEKLQSNTSSLALRTRLVFLEQRCNLMLSVVLNAVYERIERLFEYLNLKGCTFDITDIKINSSPCIPQDTTGLIQEVVQLGIGTNISLETALSRLPFIENPAQEIEKIRKEQETVNQIELDRINEYE